MKWAKLGEVCIRQKGISITAAQMKEQNDPNGAVKVFAGGATLARMNGVPALCEPSVIVKSRGHIGFDFCDEPFNHKAELWSYRAKNPDEINIKFVFYYLASQTEYFRRAAQGVKLPQISVGVTDDFKIPLPALDEQRKIAQKLDRWEAATSGLLRNLETELSLRQKQYFYYREELLSPDHLGDFSYHPLGDVCDFQNGFAFKSSLFKDSGSKIIRIKNVQNGSIILDDVAFFNPSDYRENLENFQILPGDVVVAMSGATTGKIGINNHDETFYLNQRVGKFLPHKNELDGKFLFHFLRLMEAELYRLAQGGAQPNLSAEAIKNLQIPLPPLDVQRAIADKLDRLSAAHEALAANIRAELALRSKQARYYREQLLNFSAAQSSPDAPRFAHQAEELAAQNPPNPHIGHTKEQK